MPKLGRTHARGIGHLPDERLADRPVGVHRDPPLTHVTDIAAAVHDHPTDAVAVAVAVHDHPIDGADDADAADDADEHPVTGDLLHPVAADGS
ncbi:hypothetical protein [Terrabacter aerolatus]|uniref:hypothetical protein n=1 Tax=Terrabacter aerolatus TaxID=422442 RepID=UPI001FE65381|nr:hypothetical protein [Terrabacter aerolatus]